MRLIITFCCLIVSYPTVQADTIVLKNGNRIAADAVQESNGRVQYWIGENTFTLPKSIVARIESGPPASATTPGSASASASASSSSSAISLPQVQGHLDGTDQLIARVIRNGAVDTTALRAIEQEGMAAQTAGAYSVAAGFESGRNNMIMAARYLEAALGYLPQNSVLLENYAAVLLHLGRPAEALSAAQQAVKVNPQSAEAFAVLGFAYYKNDRNREAMSALKKSLQLRPDDWVRQTLNRMERESQTEADFREQESSHFTLRYEGSEAADGLRQQILEALEDDYKDLQNDLGGSPRNIFVSLYTDQAFFDVTQAPSWSAALNDGKIRIPISGLKSVTPELARVLRHELTHSFIRQITHDHVPQWLNEGIAQLEQGASTSLYGSRLAALYASGHQIPLNQLEGRFDSFGATEASVAYAEGLAATEYIRNTFGMEDLARILRRLGEGQSIESALRSTVHAGYGELEVEITNYLRKNYGA